MSNAEERNVNPATPVAQHVPLASIKSESPPGSNGADEDSDEEDDESDSGSSPSDD